MGKTAEVHDSGAVGAGEVEGQTVLTSSGSMRHRPERTQHDEFHVSDAQKARWGIQPGETPYWARQASKWEQFEGIDRQEQLTEEYGARTVFTKEADMVKHGSDLVLMAIPSGVFEDQEAEIMQASREFERDLRPDPEDDGIARSHKTLFKRDDPDLDARMRQEHEQNKRTGFVGGNSPTAGLSLLEAEALMRRKGVDIEKMQAELRRGGRHIHMDHEQFSSVMTGEMEDARRARVAKKSVAMGNSGFPRNANSAVAQAARRAAATGGK